MRTSVINDIVIPTMGKAVSNLQLLLILVVISFLILGLDRIRLLEIPQKGAYFITNPIAFGIYKIKNDIGKQFYFIFAARYAAQENKALQDQIAQLLSENAELRRKLAEAEAFLSQEKSLDPKKYHLLPARPIGLERTLKVDKGSQDGVQAKSAAVFKDNYLGQVVQVSAGGASIRLLTDPDSKVAVFSFGKEGKAKGILVGEFGTEMLMDKILHEEKIEIGDLVYTEGTEEHLPRGLVVGRVAQVLENKNEVFKQAKIQSVFDIRDLELIFLIQN